MLVRISLALLPLGLAPAAADAAPRVHTIVMEKMKFGPMPAGIRAGDTILWVNRDIVRHTATARNGSFNVDLPARTSGRTLVRKAGTIEVFCKYHPGMKARLAVGR
jgi:plastocyanin